MGRLRLRRRIFIKKGKMTVQSIKIVINVSIKEVIII